MSTSAWLPLTDEQVAAFWSEGYVMMDDAVSAMDLVDLQASIA